VTGLAHVLNAGGGDPTSARRQANVAPALELYSWNRTCVLCGGPTWANR
jgi:hypothetical protein